MNNLNQYLPFVIENPYKDLPILAIDNSSNIPKKWRNAKEVTLSDKPKQGRNDLCNCGSGKKYKKCCL